MHWANLTATQLTAGHNPEDVIVCASGISPSGHVHIGNFREVVTTHYVVEALKKKGFKTRFIFSWDDYDRFRKVPAGLPETPHIPEGLEAFIGMPYSEVPDPYGCHASYAEHFEKAFETALARFGIVPEFIYQSQMYQSGSYTAQIREALINRHQIYDIITSYKTQDWDPIERESYYPISLYCRSCGKDTINRLHFDENEDIIEYTCACGHHEFAELEGFNRIKLTWKVDWPMRWRYENVRFEPGGRDHSAETGSYRVSSDIARRILGFEPPHYIPYEFIGLKGSHAKMSSSTGHLITPEELLNVYPPELVLFLYAKYHHGDAFDIGTDEEVNRLFSEYERYVASYQQLDEGLREILDFSRANETALHLGPKFSSIASTLPLLGYDRTLLMHLMAEFDFSDERTLRAFHQKCDYATYWLKNLRSKQSPCIQEVFDTDYYKSLSQMERQWVDEFKFLIIAQSDFIHQLSSDDLMSRIYDIVTHDDGQMRRKLQKRFFEIIYHLVLGQGNGPQLSILVKMLPLQQLVSLLSA